MCGRSHSPDHYEPATASVHDQHVGKEITRSRSPSQGEPSEQPQSSRSSTRPRRRHAAKAENRDGDAPPPNNTYNGGTGAGRVFVLAKGGEPLMPCHPARARELLTNGRAVVARHTPFTIRLKDRTDADSAVEGVQRRIDPGSKGTGIALTDTKRESTPDGTPVTVRRGLVSLELRHRGQQIHRAMGQRAGYRHRRRSANCRYRARRSHNRTRPKGWLPPSVQHRIDTTLATAHRLARYAPVTEIHIEQVAFDTHAMTAGRDLTAAEYRNGTLRASGKHSLSTPVGRLHRVPQEPSTTAACRRIRVQLPAGSHRINGLRHSPRVPRLLPAKKGGVPEVISSRTREVTAG
ncbi:RNA-guided endonuclease IscB [Streptomyces sp. 061-3]|uniref:RNA-guided endonuclease IscB n=1 Tax=Streptomyces sp. 061-3 TaxID=2789268 RepID=UPI0039816A0D